MNWLSLVPVIGDIAGAVFRGREQRESNVHDEQQSASEQLAAEFQYRGQRFWFDSLIDGINRLPRPLMAFGVMGLICYAGYDPANFSIIMQALTLVPEWLAMVFAQIILLFFGGRVIENMKFGGPTNSQVRAVLDNISAIKADRAKTDADAERLALAKAASGPDKQVVPTHPDSMPFDRQMADNSKALSNSAIAEWNARRSK